MACNFDAPALRAARTGDCDADGWCWEDPIPNGAQVHGASLPGAKDLWVCPSIAPPPRWATLAVAGVAVLQRARRRLRAQPARYLDCDLGEGGSDATGVHLSLDGSTWEAAADATASYRELREAPMVDSGPLSQDRVAIASSPSTARSGTFSISPLHSIEPNIQAMFAAQARFGFSNELDHIPWHLASNSPRRP